jgi:hypothetical protein
MYVLKRTDQGGGFVSKPGMKCSYTLNLLKARIFVTKEEAEANACPENEIALSVDSLLRN